MMLKEATLWAQKLREGIELAETFYTQNGHRLPKHIKKIAFVGMGGSGIAGRITKMFLDRSTDVISWVIDGIDLPQAIGTDTLAIVISYSGNTWETLEVLEQLHQKFIPTVVLAHAGRAIEIAEAKNLPFAMVPASVSPRSALGHFLGFLLTLLDQLSVIGGRTIVDQFIKHAEKYTLKFTDIEFFKDCLYAANGYETFHVWGVSGDVAACAYRAQTQFNENSKVHAVSSVFPELCHNLLVGFTKVTHAPLVLFYYTDFLPVKMVKAVQVATELCKEKGVALYKPPVLGDTFETQAFNVILWTDFASCYLAKSRHVDVDPVAIIDTLKEKHKQKGIK
ncbi:MAG: SIS domain-containing protein [Candidatus Babeliales bacterium]|jgi:glucose/mannose-6-phosphate isomerase